MEFCCLVCMSMACYPPEALYRANLRGMCCAPTAAHSKEPPWDLDILAESFAVVEA